MPEVKNALEIKRLPQKFVSDDRRVIARFFSPGDEARIRSVIDRVLALPESEVENLLVGILNDFGSRHRNIEDLLEHHYQHIIHYVEDEDGLTRRRRLLIGAYFTMEYAIESAALFNPSIVPSAWQGEVPEGGVRFMMSLRATGEGHVSSIVFRRGIIDCDNNIEFDPVSRFSHQLQVVEDSDYDKHTFYLKLVEMGAYDDLADAILKALGERFTLHELNCAIEEIRGGLEIPETSDESVDNMLWLARSNYQLRVPEGTDPSEIVIFPSTDNECRGIEDVRLVRFTDDDGSVRYFGTFTAYNGFRILPQLIESADFRTVKVHTLNGRYVQNKGMALFPRRIGGWYMMLSRLDGENLFLMHSDNVYFWNEADVLQTPKYPWEFVQIGNSGSPLETEAGWLLLTHGVGPMRQYCIGAMLLDRDNPSRIIGQTRRPLIVPTEEERDGYVPNVVYTCGAMIHNDTLFIPYAMSDVATTFATIPLPDLLNHLSD